MAPSVGVSGGTGPACSQTPGGGDWPLGIVSVYPLPLSRERVLTPTNDSLQVPLRPEEGC